MALTILNDENTHNNIAATITKDLTPCLVIVPFLTAIWGIQPSSITIIKRVDPITAPSLVRRRIKANVYCNQCYWHEFIIKAPCFAHHLQSVLKYFQIVFSKQQVYLQYCFCPSCAKISSNCLIESGGAGPKVNNCITFISAALQCSLDCWHCIWSPLSLSRCFTMTLPREAPELQTPRAPGEVKTRGLIIREWGSTLRCITDTLHITITFVRKIARLIISRVSVVCICMLRGLRVYLMVEVVVASVSMMYEPGVRCPIWSDNVIPTHSEHL